MSGREMHKMRFEETRGARWVEAGRDRKRPETTDDQLNGGNRLDMAALLRGHDPARNCKVFSWNIVRKGVKIVLVLGPASTRRMNALLVSVIGAVRQRRRRAAPSVQRRRRTSGRHDAQLVCSFRLFPCLPCASCRRLK